MDKIVTKIGDVIIERRKPQPQQQQQQQQQQQSQSQPQPQPSQIHQQQQNQQQFQNYQQYQQTIQQKFSNEPGNINQQQTISGLKNHPSRIEQPRPSPVVPTLNKSAPRPAVKNVGFHGPQTHGINPELVPGFGNVRKPAAQPPIRHPQPNFPQQRISETSRSIDHFQKLDNRIQLEDKVSKLGVKNIKPELLNKDSNFGNSSKTIKSGVRNQIPIKPDQTKRKEVRSEPDISKFSGISIERRKNVNVQPQEIPRNPINIPGVNVQRISAVKENASNPEPDEDYSDYEEDFEDQGSDDEDFDETGIPDPNFPPFGQFPTEKPVFNKHVQYPTNLENVCQTPKAQPPVNPAKSVQPPLPDKNLQVLDKFKQSGLTIERKKVQEVKKPVEEFNIPGIDIQRVGKVNQPKPVPSKSPLQVSSEDDDKQFEDFEGNYNEEENFDEYDENESEEYEEEPMMRPETQKMPNIPNIPGVVFEKRQRPDVNLENLAKQSGRVLEKRKEIQESVSKKPKPAFQNKSPIVLSSEDDERNEEEMAEEPNVPQKKPEPILPPGISIQKRVPQAIPQKKPQDSKFPKKLEDSRFGNEENERKEKEKMDKVNVAPKKPDPILPPGISIQKRTSQTTPDKGAQEVKFQKDAEDMRFMNEEDDQMQDYPLDEEDEFDDEENPEDYDTDQANAQFQSAPIKPPETSKVAALNKNWEKFVEKSGITIQKKANDNNKSGDSEFDSDDIENPMEEYEDMEGEGEYDEMEYGAYNEEDDGELMQDQEDVAADPTLTHENPDENKTDDLENMNESKSEEAKEEKETGISDMVCEDLVELMKKGEIEGEIEDDKDEEEEEEEKKDTHKRKAEDTEGESKAAEDVKPKRKKKKKNSTDAADEKDKDEDDEDEDDDDDEEEEGEEGEKSDKNIDKSKLTSSALRKNIREVMDETKLDESTLAAQRQEAERLKRLQDQQRIIREVQKQIQMSRQSQKTRDKNFAASLLQGNSQTSILKTSSVGTSITSARMSATPNLVSMVKLSNGQQTSLNNKKMMELIKTSKTVPKPPPVAQSPNAKTLLKQGMVTPSVSIAPMIKKEPQPQRQQPQQQLSLPQSQQEDQSEMADKNKKKDVVTLSSDSEDDCIVLSEEEESEPEEDPTNSGMHTMDRYNVPDEQGRVIVNVGHPETEQDLYLAPQIARIIKPHQIGGIRFLYDNVIESIERFQTSSGFGCILAHSMGLGKTLQIVSFSDIFLRYTTAKTILVIMPINTIQNWLAEFNMWLPKENKTDQEVRCREFDLFIVNESLKNINSRSKVILDWHRSGGVLLMGYELFRLLSLKKSNKSKKKKKFQDQEEPQDEKHKELIEEVYSALVRPGPDLVICDEGHRIKNSHATTSQALKQIRTKRRIVLTGYPLQNNLLEYWCMVDFVRPNYLGSKTEFSNMFERPIQNGQCIDSTPQDKKLMRYRAHVLHSLLEGFVQRRSHAVLQNALPDKEEYVLLLRFTPFQRKLYDTFMNEVVRIVAVPNPLKAFAVCCKIWNHPDVLYNFLKKKGEEIDLDLEEALPPSMKPPGFPCGPQPQTPTDTFYKQIQPLQPTHPQPWPKRGPGSRGGKVRAPGRPRVGRGGRKPAATIPPNSMSTNPDQGKEIPQNNENFNANTFQTPGSNFNQNQPENMLNQPGGENFQGGNLNQGQFGAPGYNNDYGNSSNNFQPNAKYGSNNKNPLDNLQDLSSGNFQNRKLFPPSNESGNQTNLPNSQQSFDSSQGDQNFNSAMNNSNDSNLNASYDSNLNSSDSTYNQNDSTKSFDYNQDYNSEFYSGGENFQNSQNSQNFPRPETKPAFVEDGNSNSNSYFQNSNFQSANANNSNYDYQSGTAGPNIQSSAGSTNFQGNHPNPNFQAAPANPNSEFMSTDFQAPPPPNFENPGSEYQGNASNYGGLYWTGTAWVPCNNDNSSGSNFVPPQKYGYEGEEIKAETKTMSGGMMYSKSEFGTNFKPDLDNSYRGFDDKKIPIKTKEEDDKKDDFKSPDSIVKKEDSLPYDWATDLFKNYVTGIIENSSKMEVFIHIVDNSIKMNDRLLVFSQSLLTLDLIEDYLHKRNVPNRDEKWAKNKNYFRLDGSTPGLEREKLINEFNSNSNIHIFLVSTRAGSLGINLVGANRVVVFDASWNPCHDTQAVCRVYRYGQQKQCYVYRLVMDSCLEKKIYDRQINKQGMADRVVDELNPDAHLSLKEVTNLCWDDQEDTAVKDYSHLKDKYNDEIIKLLLDKCSKILSKEPFQHESLLIDRKERKLTQAEKRLAKRSYELEKQAANQPKNIYSMFPNSIGPRNFGKPVASVRPMQSEIGTARSLSLPNRSRWIPAEVWQKQGMTVEDMNLPFDVTIPTNSPDKSSILLKAGQRVMVLKSPKGIYMQLENGKIIAIRTAIKDTQNAPAPLPPSLPPKVEEVKKDIPTSIASTLKNNPNVTISSKASNSIRLGGGQKQPFLKPFTKGPEKKVPVNLAMARSKQVTGKAKPFLLNRKFQSVTPEVKQRLMAGRMNSSAGEKLAGEQSGDDEVMSDERTDDEGMKESPEEKLDDKLNASDSLETLRKVTERISVDPKSDDNDPKNVQMSSLKKYRHNFPSHAANKSQDGEEGKNSKDASENEESEDVKGEESTSTQQGNENVQNWPMNQSYPPMDPYGNYFPGYYGYGPGPGPMMPPYDGFYPGHPGYPGPGHPMGRNSPMVPPPIKQEENSKTAPQQPQQALPNPNVQNVQNQTAPRNSPVLGNPPMYPPYPNPYPYPYNYPANPGFNNQGYPFPNPNPNPNNPPTTAAPSSTSTTTPNPAPNPNPNPTNPPVPPPPPNQNQPPYDNSMYNAFHRPDAPYPQGPDNPYPPPYPPRPPFPSSGTPGFFPYNAPYRPYPDPNYPYGNFNPYMHPPGYGYPMQNPPPVNNPSQNTPTNSTGNNNQPNPTAESNASTTTNNNNSNNGNNS